ncbi:hypothetical protein BDR22DRAFT_816714 [Usnea florida]
MKLSFTTLTALLAFALTAAANPIALPFAQYLGLEPRILPTCSKASALLFPKTEDEGPTAVSIHRNEGARAIRVAKHSFLPTPSSQLVCTHTSSESRLGNVLKGVDLEVNSRSSDTEILKWESGERVDGPSS